MKNMVVILVLVGVAAGAGLYVYRSAPLPALSDASGSSFRQVTSGNGPSLEKSNPIAVSPELAAFVDSSADPNLRVTPDMTKRIPRLTNPNDTRLVVAVLLDASDRDVVRNEAANLLQRSDYPGLADALISVLDNANEGPRFRAFAVQHLNDIKRNDPDLQEKINARLQSALSDRHVEVRREALLSLTTRGDALAAETAIKWLRDNPSNEREEVRDIAIRCLQILDVRSLIPAIRPLATSVVPDVQIAAMATLSTWGDEESRSSFEQASKSPNSLVKEAAAAALTRLEPSLDKVLPRQDQTVENLIKVLAHDRQRVRDQAAAALKRYGAQAKPAVAALATALKNHDGTGKIEAIAAYCEVLRSIGSDASQASSVVVALLSERNKVYNNRSKRDVHDFRAFLLLTLADISTPKEALPHILDYLNNGEDDMQFAFAAAARAAGSLGPAATDAVPLLMRALVDKFVDRPLCFDFFRAMESPNGKYTSVRLEAIHALEKIGPSAKQAIALLRRLAGEVGAATGKLPECSSAAKRAIAAIEGTKP
jgi:HEAT repeat protein